MSINPNLDPKFYDIKGPGGALPPPPPASPKLSPQKSGTVSRFISAGQQLLSAGMANAKAKYDAVHRSYPIHWLAKAGGSVMAALLALEPIDPRIFAAHFDMSDPTTQVRNNLMAAAGLATCMGLYLSMEQKMAEVAARTVTDADGREWDITTFPKGQHAYALGGQPIPPQLLEYLRAELVEQPELLKAIISAKEEAISSKILSHEEIAEQDPHTLVGLTSLAIYKMIGNKTPIAGLSDQQGLQEKLDSLKAHEAGLKKALVDQAKDEKSIDTFLKGLDESTRLNATIVLKDIQTMAHSLLQKSPQFRKALQESQ